MNTADRIFQVVRDAGVPDRNIRSTLAKLCGISVQAVRDWSEGKTKNISHEHLIKIAARYRVSLDWLITGTGSVVSEPATAYGEGTVTPAEATRFAGSVSLLSEDAIINIFESTMTQLSSKGKVRLAMILLSEVEGEI